MVPDFLYGPVFHGSLNLKIVQASITNTENGKHVRPEADLNRDFNQPQWRSSQRD